MPQSGVTISVTAETNSGGRRHMEDYLSVRLSPNETMKQIPDLSEQAYIAVFDGHGGKEAAKFAREKLWDIIQNQPRYVSKDANVVCESIREGFLALHTEMEALRASWKPYKKGRLSTAGTTASAVIFRQDSIFVANVGDSTAVLAVRNPLAELPGQSQVIAQVLTKDHKPDDPEESRQVESLGGKVMLSKKGVSRVVWERKRTPGSEDVDLIPFLSVSRSLGDFWSYNDKSKQYAVSPLPDVSVIPLDLSKQKFVVIASDGLWNVMTPNEVVKFIWDYEHDTQSLHIPRDVVRALINTALARWKRKFLFADNISVLIAFLSEGEGAKETSTGLGGCVGSVTPQTLVLPESSCAEDVSHLQEKELPIPQLPSDDIKCHEPSSFVGYNNNGKWRRRKCPHRIPECLSLAPTPQQPIDLGLCRSPIKRDCGDVGGEESSGSGPKKPKLECLKRLVSDGSDASSGIFSDESRGSPDCIKDPISCADTLTSELLSTATVE